MMGVVDLSRDRDLGDDMDGQLDVVDLSRSSSDEILPKESYSANVSSTSDFQDGSSKNGESKAG
jgi:hypothetical protein